VTFANDFFTSPFKKPLKRIFLKFEEYVKDVFTNAGSKLGVRCFVIGADKRTLIPIIYRPCKIPDILRYIAMLDYTREDAKPWFWQRLASSLRTVTPQSAILHPFPGAPGGYPVPRPFDYSAPGTAFEPAAPVPASGFVKPTTTTTTILRLSVLCTGQPA